MASDQQVTAAVVLRTLSELQRIGATRAMERLEQVEPDLADYLLENLSLIHHQILDLGGPAKESRRAYRRVERLVLVCVEAVRKGHFLLWQEAVGETPLARLDPATPHGDPPAAPPDPGPQPEG